MKYLILSLALLLALPVSAQHVTASYAPQSYSVGYEADINDYFSTTTYISQHQTDATSLSNRFAVYPVKLNISSLELRPVASVNAGALFAYGERENFIIGSSAGLEISYKLLSIVPAYQVTHSENSLYSDDGFSLTLKLRR